MKPIPFSTKPLAILIAIFVLTAPVSSFAQETVKVDTSTIKSNTLSQILNAVDSPSPKITGGCISLTIASLSNSMILMAMDVSAKNEVDTNRKEEINKLVIQLRTNRDSLVRAADIDNNLFQRFLSAYRLPHKSTYEKNIRDSVIHQTLIDATESPLKAAEIIKNNISIHNQLIALVAKNVKSDVVAGTILLDATFQAIITIADDNITQLIGSERLLFQKQRDQIVKSEKNIYKNIAVPN